MKRAQVLVEVVLVVVAVAMLIGIAVFLAGKNTGQKSQSISSLRIKAGRNYRGDR